jgi:hypothetical protein
MINKNNIQELREMPLGLVMERMGAEPDPADPRRNYLHPAGRITVTENKFYNHTQGKGGGGAIDLAMHLGECSFKEAISWLAKEVGKEETITQYKVEARTRVEKIMESTPVPKLAIPSEDQKKLPQVIEYLANSRNIPKKLLENSVLKKNLWADKNGNCVFALRNAEGKTVGAEIRGTYDKPFHGTRGEKAKAFFYTGTSAGKKAVFTESAIDALSYQTMYPDTLVIGTNGTRREAVVETAKRLQGKGFKITLAFDNDKAGIKLATNIMQDLQGNCTVESPKSGFKDWNDQLQKECTPIIFPPAQEKTKFLNLGR